MNRYAEGAVNQKQSQSEFWIALQRLWSFDEPKARWARLLKNCQRLERSPTGQTSEARETNELLRMAEFYGSVGAGNAAQEQLPVRDIPQSFDQEQHANLTLTVLMALADLSMFQPNCLNVQTSDASIRSASTLLPLAWSSLLEQIVSTRELSHEARRYLYFYASVCPDWRRLVDDGPWSYDARARFVSDTWRMLLDAQKEVYGGDVSVTYDRFLNWERLFHDRLGHFRTELPGSFLPAHLILVEGATEQILFPCFARLMKLDWHKRALAVLAAGGAKQVCKRYANLKGKVRLRVDCVLDGDVSAQAKEIESVLRPEDRLLVLDAPSVEETFTREQLTFFCSQYFQASIYPPVTLDDLQGQTNQECLERLWRKRTQASFDKIGFARTVAENLHEPQEIPLALRQMIEQIASRSSHG